MKIIVLCGKSASGKDTVQTELIKRGYEKLISSTTRPIRPSEVDGREYYFRTKEDFMHLLEAGKLIEHRKYETLVDGTPDTWFYGLERRELAPNKCYVTILDLDGLESLKMAYGKDVVLPIYLKATDALRKQRCIDRGDFNKPEWNRRLKTDRVDFSPDKLTASDVWTIRVNERLTPKQIADMVEENLRFVESLDGLEAIDDNAVIDMEY